MSKLKIIDEVYRSEEYKSAANNITGCDPRTSDLFHQLIVCLFKYDEDKIIGLYQRGELKWFCTRIMMVMWRCKTGPFFKAYRREEEEPEPANPPKDKLREIADKIVKCNLISDSWEHAVEKTLPFVTEAHSLGKSESDNAKAVEVLRELKVLFTAFAAEAKLSRDTTSLQEKYTYLDGRHEAYTEALSLIETEIQSLTIKTQDNGRTEE